MLKIIFIKVPTMILTIITVIIMFLVIYQINGFKFSKNHLTDITYNLMLSGSIFGAISLALILLSTFFGKWITFNQSLWGIGIFMLFVGIILLGLGEGYFISTNEVNKTSSTTIMLLSLLPGLGAVIIGTTWFIRNKKDNNLKSEIEIKQVNRKLRLFLLIIFNWYITALPIILPISMILLISMMVKNYTLVWSIVWGLLFLFVALLPILFHRLFIMGIGIKYLPENYSKHYFKKNNNQLEKINNIKITNVTQLFNVTPICDEVYRKNERFEYRTKQEFRKLSQIEVSTNRLVVNGKINNLDFSWGIVTEMKKTNFKVFLFAILYFGPILGIFIGLFPQTFVNAIYSQSTWTLYNIDNYTKLGGIDLFPHNVGRVNSENYLIFAAKLQKQHNTSTLIPNNDNQYQWPSNLSETQKKH